MAIGIFPHPDPSPTAAGEGRSTVRDGMIPPRLLGGSGGELPRVGCIDEPRIGWFINTWMPALIAIEGVQGD